MSKVSGLIKNDNLVDQLGQLHQQEGLLILVKQYQRAFLSGIVLVWFIQKEDESYQSAPMERRIFDRQGTMLSQLFDYLSQGANLMQNKLFTIEDLDAVTSSAKSTI